MALSDEELAYLEKLARVRLSGESREKLRSELERIIGFVKQLQGIDTAGIEARAYVGGFEQHMRDDVTTSCLSRDEVMEEAPESDGGFFVVPPVIDTEES
jgi:aspartyl-tRNA(Asn)/glutamyl-tRNA(Gln) amidotransferase subunit C